MPLVKLTIRAEPQEVGDDELAALQGQGLVERVLDKPAEGPRTQADPPANASAKADGASKES